MSCRHDVAARIRVTPVTRARVAPSTHSRVSWDSKLPAQNDLAERAIGFHQVVRAADIGKWHHPIDNRLQPSRLEQSDYSIREFPRQRNFLLQRSRPQSGADYRCAFSQQTSHIE